MCTLAEFSSCVCAVAAINPRVIFLILMLNLIDKTGDQNAQIPSGQNPHNQIENDPLVADLYILRYIHVDIQLLHQIFLLLRGMFQYIIVTYVTHQNQVVHVFEVHFNGVYPEEPVVEAEEYVGCIVGNVQIREKMAMRSREESQ